MLERTIDFHRRLILRKNAGMSFGSAVLTWMDHRKPCIGG